MRTNRFFIIYILCLLIRGCSGHKSDQEAIKDTIHKLGEYASHEDFNKFVNMIHPEVFRDKSRREYVREMNQNYHSSNFDMKVLDMEADSMSVIIPSGSDKYALIKTRVRASLTMRAMPGLDSIKNAIYLDSTFLRQCSGLKEQYGEPNVKCESKEKRFDIVSYDYLYLIYESQYKKWFFMDRNIHGPVSIVHIIPDTVLKQLAQ